jgi:NADPH-dependent ferric siderophore reductase
MGVVTTDPDAAAETVRRRREPPRFRPVTVAGTQQLSPRLMRVTLTGSELQGLVIEQPASSVRVLLPSPGEAELVIPRWNGNEFLLSGGRRPAIRTFTPGRVDDLAQKLDIDVVIHGRGVASAWAESAVGGEPAAVSGPGRGYVIDRDAPAFLLAGDETALPAIGQVIAAIPRETPVQVVIEVADARAQIDLLAHPRAEVAWLVLPPEGAPGDALVTGVRDADIAPETRVWAAGEAAAMQRVRRHLFEERGLPRRHALVRGYWKYGRAGDTDAGSST